MMTRRDFLACSVAASVSALRGARPAHAQAAGKDLFERVRAGEPLEGVDVVDAHTHFEPTSNDLIFPLSAELLLADMKRCGIGQAIVSPFQGFMAATGDQLKAAHDQVAAAVASNPKSLRAYLVFHPHLRKVSEAEMQRALEPASPFVGFKLHGAIDQYPADGPNYQPVYEFASEHGLPVLNHQFEGVDRIGPVMKKYPRLKMTLAHIAFLPETETVALLKEYPNLYVDTCSSTLPYRYLERFVRQVGAERLLFGTDATYLCVGSQIAKVALARISEEEKRLIFGANARRLFGHRLSPPSA